VLNIGRILELIVLAGEQSQDIHMAE